MATRTYVVSTMFEDPPWNNAQVRRSFGDGCGRSGMAAVARDGRVEAEDRPLLVHASVTLARSLATAGLVDRHQLLEFPVAFGAPRCSRPTPTGCGCSWWGPRATRTGSGWCYDVQR